MDIKWAIAIVSVVKHATTALRRADGLGRYGGEEFVALLPKPAREQALVVAERIRTAVEKSADDPRCTVSIGIATNNVKLQCRWLANLADERCIEPNIMAAIGWRRREQACGSDGVYRTLRIDGVSPAPTDERPKCPTLISTARSSNTNHSALAKSPTILLIMGLGMQLTNWPDAFCQRLVDAGFRVIRFDNRDIGLSGKVHVGRRVNMKLALLAAFLKLPVRALFARRDGRRHGGFLRCALPG
ncbi:MAG: diguanylate cyclase [Rhodocyclaceae bacterium]|nr:diguanylate cyclase [Rhodocyclaceae bacterium]